MNRSPITDNLPHAVSIKPIVAALKNAHGVRFVPWFGVPGTWLMTADERKAYDKIQLERK